MKKITKKIKADNERGARENVLEELFYDLNRSRVQIYKMNFFRGVFFGLGSVLGATLVVALIIWLLSWFVDIPGVGHAIENIQNALQSSGKK